MLIYKKYVTQSAFPLLAVVSLVFTSLVWVTQILKLLYFLDKGISLSDFLKLIILILPSLLFSILPIITLFSLVFLYQRLSEERQLIIFKTCGLSNWKIAEPALIIATFVMIITYCISAYLLPVSYSKMKSKTKLLRNNYVSSAVDARKFNQISRNITLYIDAKDEENNFIGIILFDNTVPQNETVFFAKYGSISFDKGEAYMNLTDGFRQTYDNNGNLMKLFYEHLVVKINNDRANSGDQVKNSLELFIWDLLFPPSDLPQELRMKFIADGHQRVIWPMFNFVFSLVALSTLLRMPYTRKVHWQPIISSMFPVLLVAFVHFSVQKLSYTNLNFIFFCYANVILSTIISITYLTKRGR